MVIDPLGNVVLQTKEHEEGIYGPILIFEEVDKVRGRFVFVTVARTCIIKECLCYLKNLTY